MSDAIRVAIIGSRGIPARYGGFETFVEELAPRLVVRGHRVTVYCRRGQTGENPPSTFRGVDLAYPPFLPIRSLETLSHELTAIVASLREPFDAYYFLGTRAAPWYLLAKRTRRGILVHTDGLEWRRRKWSRAGRAYLKWAEGIAARRAADELITDAVAMQDYYQRRYAAPSHHIPYGAPVIDGVEASALTRWDLEAGSYDLVVCRLEPENNVDRIIEEHVAAGTGVPLVVVGDVSYPGRYQRDLLARAGPSARFLGAVYDDADALYAGARLYLHGHEVGGLNPSLLRAMGAGACPFALDTVFNREAVGSAGKFWTTRRGDLERAVRWADDSPDEVAALAAQAQGRVRDAFSWESAADAHDAVLRELVRRKRGVSPGR